MKKIFEKASELGSAIADSVKGTADDIKDAAEGAFSTETGFLVEQFDDENALAVRLNTLQGKMKEVNLQAMCYKEDCIIAALKIVD